MAPSYSSTGDMNKVVTSLGIQRVSTMIMSGKPNRPFPEEFGIDIDSFTEGGKQAIELVTKCLEEQDYSSLDGLVSDSCISRLQTSLKDLTNEEKEYLSVNSSDIFFSFIPSFKIDSEQQSLILVTFSLPGLSHIKSTIASNKEEFEASMKEIVQEAKDGKIEASAIKESLNEKLYKNGPNDPHQMFQTNEIIIGNYTFNRDGKNSDWTLAEISQVNSVTAWAWIFRKRWKGRLGLSLRGMDFHKVLRYDYMTDWIAYVLIFNLFLMGGPRT